MSENKILANQFLEGLEDGTPIEPITPTPVEPITPPAPTPTPNEPPAPTPPAEPTPTEPPPTPTPTDTLTDEIRLKAFNDAMGTNFQSLEEVNTIKSSLEQLPELQKVKTQYEELAKTPIAKFHNDRIKQLNTFAEATGIDDPGLFTQIKRFEAAESKDPIEALVLAEIIKNPDLAEKKDLLRKSIEKEYKTKYDPDLFGDELEVAKSDAELEQFRLERNAMKATQEINQILEKVNTGSGPTVDHIQSQKEVLKAQWESIVVDKAQQLFGKVDIEVQDGKDESGKDKIEVIDQLTLTPEEAQEASQRVIKNVLSSGLELNEANLVTAVKQEYANILAKNLNKVNAMIAAKKESALRMEFEKKYNNPSQVRIETPVVTGNEPIDASDAIDKAFANRGY